MVADLQVREAVKGGRALELRAAGPGEGEAGLALVGIAHAAPAGRVAEVAVAAGRLAGRAAGVVVGAARVGVGRGGRRHARVFGADELQPSAGSLTSQSPRPPTHPGVSTQRFVVGEQLSSARHGRPGQQASPTSPGRWHTIVSGSHARPGAQVTLAAPGGTAHGSSAARGSVKQRWRGGVVGWG
jgi:hypothetical protein